MPLTLQADVLARATALGLKARGIVEGLRIGEHKSPFRGFSVEFVQHREYVPGDDIRHIDWKSYGRSERYTIKQAVLLLALQRLGVAKAEALYVGDMTVDVETARAAGVSVWVVPTGSDSVETLDRAGPDRRLGELAEITRGHKA